MSYNEISTQKQNFLCIFAKYKKVVMCNHIIVKKLKFHFTYKM